MQQLRMRSMACKDIKIASTADKAADQEAVRFKKYCETILYKEKLHLGHCSTQRRAVQSIYVLENVVLQPGTPPIN